MKLLVIFFLLLSSTWANTYRDWWKHTTIYQIFIASFKDSNGDGIGDLKGITSKLDYFAELGIDCLYITSFFKCGIKYAGYDITNYTDIDPTYGTMQDFDQLMREMKRRKMKLIIDLVINHSGIQHEWFLKSQQKIDKYTDYYVWIDPKGYDHQRKPIPPNNWVDVFGNVAWAWNEKREQFYLHQFTADQPDLNFRNEDLKAEIKQILAFWIDKGVCGIRLDAAQYFVEDSQLLDEPLANPNKKIIDKQDDLIHIYTANQPETYQVLHEFRTFTDQYTKRNKFSCIYLAESTTASDDQLKNYFGRPNYPVIHTAYNFKLFDVKWYTAEQFNNQVMEWMNIVPSWSAPNWMTENQDFPRVANRYCDEYSLMLTTAIMTLPGLAVIYYGQEIAIRGFSPPDVFYDRFERLPMQWDDSLNAGFTTNRKPWLPVHSNYWQVNVAKYQQQKSSPYQMFKQLLRLRRTKTLKYGRLKTYIISTWVYAFVRSYQSYESFITLLNFGTSQEMVDLHHSIPNLPQQLKVALASTNAGYETGHLIRNPPEFPNVFTMRPLSCVVFTTKLEQNFLTSTTTS